MITKCLSIAGFDGSGGAGIQADLKTFAAFGCYGMTVLTALPIQNTCGVRRCYDIPLQSIEDQLEAIFDDIIPDSIKIGMLFSNPIIELVARFLEKNARDIPIILDPVMVAKSGHHLLQPDALDSLKHQLIPLSAIITPNLPEAYVLSHKTEDMNELAEQLLTLGSNAVLLKGGHAGSFQSNDVFIEKAGIKTVLEAPRIESNNTHGTGCTLSAAICAGIGRGLTTLNACQQAKVYLSNAIQSAKDNSIGKGHGPVDHFFNIQSKLKL